MPPIAEMPSHTETPEDVRARIAASEAGFFQEFEKRAAPHRERAFDYEKLAVDYSEKGFQSLTYLNGGALVAIPTALAFFKAEISPGDVLTTAGIFVAGLLFVVIAQVSAFFTMAKRSEASEVLTEAHFHRVAALMSRAGTPENLQRVASAQSAETDRNKRLARSNTWRYVGLCFFAASLIAFVIGCLSGARTVLVAKDKVTASQLKP